MKFASVRDVPRRRPRMQPAQPRPRRDLPYPLPEDHEHQQGQVIREQHAAKDARDDDRVPVLDDPVEQERAHAERDGLLAEVHRDQHLRSVGVVRVDRVRQREGEVEVGAPVLHRHARKVRDPVQVALRGEAVQD